MFRSERRLLGRHRRRPLIGPRLFGALCLVAFAAGMIGFGQHSPDIVATARARLAGPVAGILDTLRVPYDATVAFLPRLADFSKRREEIESLRRENEALQGWKWRAMELERQLAELGALNKVIFDSGHDTVTVPIKARALGHARHTALIGAGSRAGVNAGLAVLNVRGLVGTTFEVGRGTSRLRFLIDDGARVLVSIGRRGQTAIARGTGGRYLFIEGDVSALDIADGDSVATAGDFAGMPRGIRIGKVVRTASGFRILPDVDFDRLEFVSVLLTDAPDDPRAAGASAESWELEQAARRLAARRDDPSEGELGADTNGR